MSESQKGLFIEQPLHKDKDPVIERLLKIREQIKQLDHNIIRLDIHRRYDEKDDINAAYAPLFQEAINLMKSHPRASFSAIAWYFYTLVDDMTHPLLAKLDDKLDRDAITLILSIEGLDNFERYHPTDAFLTHPHREGDWYELTISCADIDVRVSNGKYRLPGVRDNCDGERNYRTRMMSPEIMYPREAEFLLYAKDRDAAFDFLAKRWPDIEKFPAFEHTQIQNAMMIFLYLREQGWGIDILRYFIEKFLLSNLHKVYICSLVDAKLGACALAHT